MEFWFGFGRCMRAFRHGCAEIFAVLVRSWIWRWTWSFWMGFGVLITTADRFEFLLILFHAMYT